MKPRRLLAAPLLLLLAQLALPQGLDPELELRHGPLLDATYVLDGDGSFVGFRATTRLSGRKTSLGPARLAFAVLLPEGARARGLSLFLDAELIRPWTVEGELVAFHAASDVAARVGEAFMAPPPGMRWWGFRSDPLWSTVGGLEPLEIDERLNLSVVFESFPAPRAPSERELHLYRAFEGVAGNVTITHWPLRTLESVESRSVLSWPAAAMGLGFLAAGWIVVRRRSRP